MDVSCQNLPKGVIHSHPAHLTISSISITGGLLDRAIHHELCPTAPIAPGAVPVFCANAPAMGYATLQIVGDIQAIYGYEDGAGAEGGTPRVADLRVFFEHHFIFHDSGVVIGNGPIQGVGIAAVEGAVLRGADDRGDSRGFV